MNNTVLWAHSRRLVRATIWLMLGAVSGFPVFAEPVFAEPAFTAGFTAPNRQADPFVANLVEAMQAAADDLNVELQINYGSRGVSLYARRKGQKLIDSGKLDYFITGFWPGGAKYHVPKTSSVNIGSFVINSPPPSELTEAFASPRTQWKHWLGQMTPDNRQGAYELTDTLIGIARQKQLVDENGRVQLIALSGSSDDSTARERTEGLQQRVDQGGAAIHKIVLAGWSKQTAAAETGKLLSDHPTTSVIWAASDLMAQGAAEAAEKLGRVPGEDILIGGFDWNESALKDIANGRIAASVGGHFLEGAWALVLLHDYHNNIDFADDPGIKINSPMFAITRDNMEQYADLLGEADWSRLDFKRFSKASNPDLKRYNFSLPAVLNALKAAELPGRTSDAVAAR